VIPKSGPASPETTALVNTIRGMAPAIEKKYNTAIAVTGATAIQIDISTRLNNALIPFGLIVVGLSIILLMMVFRSVFIPIKAAVGFLLSVFASFGTVVAVFQWGWFANLFGIVPGPILSFMPILLMAVLFGLAMDYEVFLVSGMRESWVHTGDTKRSIVHGFSGAARVVTAAALIMFFVFFAFVPEGMATIKVIALGLAVGVLADAFLVRMTLVPAAMALAGRFAWWMPRWLSRLLPNVDIEGEQLREHRDAVEWAHSRSEDAISAEYLEAGTWGASIGPVSVSIAPGSLVLASGTSTDRSILAATLAGRLSPLAGRAHVLGHPLPSEQSRVARLVALADVGGSERAILRVSLIELLEERLRLTLPWYRVWTARRRAADWISRVNAALGGGNPVLATSTMDELPQLERALALSVVAFAEHTPVVMLNQFDGFAESNDEEAFLVAIDRLAPLTTTVVIGTPIPPRAIDRIATGRSVTEIDLYSLDSTIRKAALQ
jgi:RND superfamily putative drug exporter